MIQDILVNKVCSACMGNTGIELSGVISLRLLATGREKIITPNFITKLHKICIGPLEDRTGTKGYRS
jgi:hypothetical protein